MGHIDPVTREPAGVVEIVLKDPFNQRAVCAYHKCNCWLHCRVDATEEEVRADLVAWLRDGKDRSKNEHLRLAYDLKVAYGMRPKKLPD